MICNFKDTSETRGSIYHITTAMAIAFARGREVNRTQWALGRYPWKIVIVLSVKDGRKQNKEQCNQAVN